MAMSRDMLRGASLLLGATILVAGCSLMRQPPASADTQFSVVIYNRMQAPVFALFREVAACPSSRIPATALLVEGATSPPGVAQFPGAITINTPRGYAGTVSVVLTAGGSSTVTLGDIPGSSLPACRGTP